MEEAIGKMMDTIPLPLSDIDEMETLDDTESLQADSTTLDMVQIVLSNSEIPQTDSNTARNCPTSTVPTVIPGRF